jgi:hypothetical protein
MFDSLADGYVGCMRRARSRAAPLVVAVGLGLAACGGSDDTPTASDSSSQTVAASEASPTDVAGDQRYPDVVDAAARQDGETWAFDVTISSPYDTPERYADGWRVLAPDGTELGFRLLTHDHAAEQPFTRSLDGVEIPDDVDVVTIEGRDQANGFGGETFELTITR